MKVCPTGISVLDKLLGGGLIKGSSVLLSGGPGTGKTILAMQFLCNGISKYNENGLLVTFEEQPTELKKEAEQFTWGKSIKDIIFLDCASGRAKVPSKMALSLSGDFDLKELCEELYGIIHKKKIKRIVVDSVSALSLKWSDTNEVREAVHILGTFLQKLDCTSLLISELLPSNNSLSRYGIEEFLTQGVVKLSLEELEGELRRNLLIWKMRGIKHSMKKHPFIISKNGIEIYEE